MPGGRPSKLTPECRERLVQAIKDGHYLETACHLAGIDYSTFARWMQRGERDGRGEFREFRKAVLAAQAEVEDHVLKTWTRLMPENWQACKEFLARRFPERWRQREEHQHTGAQGGPLRLTLQQAVEADEELEEW